ncbi:MAG: hypothetical protein AB7N70_10500 [Dehalococcoidia bacterium]
MTPLRWQSLLHDLGAPPDDITLARLKAAYGERHRAYHTAEHIAACLTLFDEWRGLAHEPAEVACALWFHDAVYNPSSSNNEEMSAGWAAEFLAHHGADAGRIERVRQLILATRHAAEPPAGDAQFVVDIDLAILGSEPEAYARFEAQVRQEYHWVPAFIFKHKRREILRSFLERPQIYATAAAFERFEAAARRNLGRSIDALS